MLSRSLAAVAVLVLLATATFGQQAVRNPKREQAIDDKLAAYRYAALFQSSRDTRGCKALRDVAITEEEVIKAIRTEDQE